jgi:hypothetical protein
LFHIAISCSHAVYRVTTATTKPATVIPAIAPGDRPPPPGLEEDVPATPDVVVVVGRASDVVAETPVKLLDKPDIVRMQKK